uniref:RRM domain-containing protein n=1 Tax=Oryza glumipatula TaxID=40148 RepID=A0A0D9YW89_9ORYZ
MTVVKAPHRIKPVTCGGMLLWAFLLGPILSVSYSSHENPNDAAFPFSSLPGNPGRRRPATSPPSRRLVPPFLPCAPSPLSVRVPERKEAVETPAVARATSAKSSPPSSSHPIPRKVFGLPMESDEDAKKGYADFEERVKRTIYIDHLSPQVTSSVIEAAISQCARVVNVDFIVNYTIPYDIPSAALVELDDEIQAKAAIDLMNNFPFIIGGKPRPVRAIYAKHEMFQDRPPRPGIKKEFRWVKQEDGIEYEGMNKLRLLARRQETENMALIKNLLEEDKDLAKQQQELLDGIYKKYCILDSDVMNDIKNLSRRYGVNLAGD